MLEEYFLRVALNIKPNKETFSDISIEYDHISKIVLVNNNILI